MTQDAETPAVENGNGAAESEESQSLAKIPTRKSRPTKLLPTDRIAPPKQLDILRAWGAASGQTGKVVTNSEVASVVGLAASTVALANPFFVENGLLQKTDAGFLPTADVLNFARSYEWNPERAAQKLAPTIGDTWFAKSVRPKLGFRPLDEREAIQILADEVSAGPEYADQLRTVLFFMHAAGVTQQEGQQIKAARLDSPIAQVTPTPDKPAISPEGGSAASLTGGKSVVSTAFQELQEGTVQFHISVKVGMKEFATWPPDLVTRFFGGIAEVLRAKAEIEQGAKG